MKRVAIILGTTRPTRISPEIAKWAQNILNRGPVQYSIIDLKQLNLPFLDEEEMPITGNYHNQHTIKWSKTIKSYDGVIFLFPQYNWGYPAVIKNAIDYLGQEWRDKPVSCITYGFHGGTQAYSSMLLIMNCLKMKRMAVNPTISINKNMFNDQGFTDVNQNLKRYEDDIKLLKMNFENMFRLNKIDY